MDVKATNFYEEYKMTSLYDEVKLRLIKRLIQIDETHLIQ